MDVTNFDEKQWWWISVILVIEVLFDTILKSQTSKSFRNDWHKHHYFQICRWPHFTAWPFSSSSVCQNIHWLNYGGTDIPAVLIIIPGTLQEINRVVVDLINVIYLLCCLMWHQSTRLISQLLPFNPSCFKKGKETREMLKFSKVERCFNFRWSRNAALSRQKK